MNISAKLRFLQRWASGQTIYSPPSDSPPCSAPKASSPIPNQAQLALELFMRSQKPTTSCAPYWKITTNELEHSQRLDYLLNQLLVRRALKDWVLWLDAERYQSISIMLVPTLLSGVAGMGLIIRIFRAGELCAERCVPLEDIL